MFSEFYTTEKQDLASVWLLLLLGSHDHQHY